MDDKEFPAGKPQRREAPGSLGPELRQIFDPEQEDYPPLFFETVQLADGIEEDIARHEEFSNRVLRRFFREIGLDYDAWKRRRRRRRILVLVATLTLICAMATLVSTQPQVIEAIRRPLVRWFEQAPAPPAEPQITHYQSVAEVQSLFSIPLPRTPPAGFRLVGVSLTQRDHADPRLSIRYQRGDTEDRAQPGNELSLRIWSLADQPFSYSVDDPHEEIEIRGLQGLWVKGTRGGSTGQKWRPEGGWVIWEQTPYKLALRSGSLSREEMIQIAEEIVGQQEDN